MITTALEFLRRIRHSRVAREIEPHYVELRDGEFRETQLRPALREIDVIAQKVARIEARTYKHRAGDGIHYVPSPLAIVRIGKEWIPMRRQSHTAIWAHADDICRVLGLSYADLRLQFHPDESRYIVSAQDRADCATRATLSDALKVCADLRAIREHEIARCIEQKLSERR